MISAGRRPNRRRGLDARTRHWHARCDVKEGKRLLRFIDDAMREGRHGAAVLEEPGELLLPVMGTRQASLEGFKDFLHAEDCTDVGTINYLPRFGAQAAESQLNAYVTADIQAADWPGITLNGHSIAVFTLSNFLGTFNEGGWSASAGTKPIMVRSSGGFRGGIWMGANQTLQGAAIAVGFHGGTRTGASTVIGRSNGATTLAAITALSLPNQDWTLLSVEPSKANSPNAVGAFWAGGPLTEDQIVQLENILFRLFRNIGTWQEIEVQPLTLGAHAWGPNSLNDIIGDLQINRQRHPPLNDDIAAASYIGYPLTSATSRFFIAGNQSGPTKSVALASNPITTGSGTAVLTIARTAHGLSAGHAVTIAGAAAGHGLPLASLNGSYLIATVPNADSFTVVTDANASASSAIGGESAVLSYIPANPITTTNGSDVLVVEHTAHGLEAGRDTLVSAGATGGNGILAADINRRFIVSATPTADTFEIVAGAAATGSGAIGGADVSINFSIYRDHLTTFSFPRGGKFGCFIWSPRGERSAPDAPVGGTTRPNSTEGVRITRTTDGPGGMPPAGIECRPGYEFHREAAGAAVVQAAWVAGFLARDDVRLTVLSDGTVKLDGWGYLDIAEHYGLDASKVILVQQAYVDADDIFTESVEGFATSYGYVLLQPGTISNVPNIVDDKKMIVIDMEHKDGRSAALHTEMCEDVNAICAAAGIWWTWLGHFLYGSHASLNGWFPENTRHIQQLSRCVAANVIAIKRESPEAAVQFVVDQLELLKGPDGTDAVDYDKVCVSLSSAAGSNEVPLDQCEAIGDWVRAQGITQTHWRRAGQQEGGVITHPWQQQHIAYYPNLGTGPDLTDAVAQGEALEAAINAAGATVSTQRAGLMVDLYATLIDAGLFDELEIMTIFAAENTISARMDWRLRALGNVFGGTAEDLLVTDRWFLGDGVDDYFDHRWAPSQSLVMGGSEQMLAVYSVDATAQNSVYVAGAVNGGSQGLRLNPFVVAGGVQRMQGQAGTDNGTVDGPFVSSSVSGLFWTSYNGTVQEFGRNGTSYGTRTPTGTSSSLSTRNLYTGCINNNGSVSGFRAGKRLATIVGKRQTAANMGILAAALETYFTALGAI